MAPSGEKRSQSADDWLIEPANRPPEEEESGGSSEDFVIDEDKHDESESESRSVQPDAAQWLVEGLPDSNGRKSATTDVPAAQPARGDSQELGQAKQELEQIKATLEAERAKNVELHAALRGRDANLDKTLQEREAEFAQALRERDEALRQREAELEEQLSQGYAKREADLDRQFDQRQLELEKQLAVLEDRLNAREAELRDRATRREAKLMSRIEELQSQLADAKLGMDETPTPKRPRRGGSGKNGTLDLNYASFEELRDLGLSVTQCARVIAYRDTRGGFDSVDELDEIPGLPKDTRVALRSRLSL
jgi:DNA uptake protein ComE-like DNA-binding protein